MSMSPDERQLLLLLAESVSAMVHSGTVLTRATRLQEIDALIQAVEDEEGVGG